jgi:hypothetical protein
MKKSALRAAFVGVVAASTVAAHSAPVIVDTFSQGPFELLVNADNPIRKATQTGLSGVLGGQRDVLLEYVSGPQNVHARLATEYTFTFFNADALTKGNLTLQYDGVDDESGNPFALNNGNNLRANLSGQDRFQFLFVEVNPGIGPYLPIFTTVVSGEGATYMERTVETHVNGGLNVVHNIFFSEFTGIDFSDVRRVQFQFVGMNASDFTLEAVGAGSFGDVIPGPLAAIPFLTGLIAMRRRKKK